MTIDGHTELIPLIGYPTFTFKSPLIYNPYFDHAGINARVVPMGCQPEHFEALVRSLLTLTNLRGLLITMPHKVSTVALLDEASPAVRVAGACNAVRRAPDGRLVGDLFDGTGFVRSLRLKGLVLRGARVLVVGCGGVGSAIAAALAAEGITSLTLHDVSNRTAARLADRLTTVFPGLNVQVGSNDPAGLDLVVNASPLGMHDNDPLPVDVNRLQPATWVGEVVMRGRLTPLLAAAQARGCPVQVGTDMLFEQIPDYLAFFGLPVTDAAQLRALAQLEPA